MPVGNLSENALIDYMMMRADVAVPLIVRDMGVSPSTAVGMMARLVEKGFAARIDENSTTGATSPGATPAIPAGKRGRPAVAYRLRMPGRVLALEMDGTLLAGVLFDRDLSVLAVTQDRLDSVAQLADVVPLVDRLARRIADEAIANEKNAKSVTHDSRSTFTPTNVLLDMAGIEGVALVANAVEVGGKAMTSSVMPWVNETLPARVADVLGMPVGTSGNIIAPAEFRVMSEPRPNPMLLLRVADGVSAHSVVAGTSFVGANRLSGELGHITVDPDGPLCGCGRRGCLETFCSGPAIMRRLLEGLRDGAGSDLKLDVLQNLLPRQAIELVHDAYAAGDSFARDTMDRVFERLAWGVGLVTNLFDPEAIVMGGYILQNKPAWHEQIAERSKRWTMHAGKRDLRFVGARATIADELRLAALQLHFDQSTRMTQPTAAAATASK